MQVEGIAEMTEGEDGEPVASPFTERGVSFMSVDCLVCFVGIQNCQSAYKSALVKQ